MKFIVLPLLLSMPTLACINESSNGERLDCLQKQEYSLAIELEINLQKIYKLQDKSASEEIRLKELKNRIFTEQSKWEEYSAAYCKRKAMAFYEGTEEPLEESRCFIDLITSRIEDIKLLFQEMQ